MTDTAPEEVELDLGSFNRAERLELQKRFDNNFMDLRSYIVRRELGEDGRLIKLVDDAGNTVFADDVLRLMVHIVRRRSNPQAKETDIDSWTWSELNGAITVPKSRNAQKPKSSKKT